MERAGWLINHKKSPFVKFFLQQLYVEKNRFIIKQMVLAERNTHRELPFEIPEAKQLVDRFVLGDQDAFTVIDGYLRPHLIRFFSVRLRNDADDLTQQSLMRIARGLSKFKDRYSEDTDFSDHLVLSCFSIAKSVFRNELRKQISRDRLIVIPTTTDRDSQKDVSTDTLLTLLALRNSQPLPSIEDEINKKQQEAEQKQLMIMLREKIADILHRPSVIKVINLALDGKTRKEIAVELGCKDGTVGALLSQARVKIERELVFPAGYRRAIRFGRNVQRVVSTGRKLPILKFLGMLYITEEEVLRYQNTKQAVDKKLLDDGYLPFSMLRPQETIILRRKYPQLLKQHRGLTYIHKEQLEEFRRSVPRPVLPENIGENSQYMKVIEFAKTQREYGRLLYAVRKGRLRSVKQGRNWLVIQKDVDEFRQQQRELLKKRGPKSPSRETVIFDSAKSI